MASQRTLIAGAQEACAINTGTAKSFSSATCVRLYNGTGTARLITVVEEQGGTVVGSFTMLGNSVEFLEKKPWECVFAADNSVLGAKVGLTG